MTTPVSRRDRAGTAKPGSVPGRRRGGARGAILLAVIVIEFGIPHPRQPLRMGSVPFYGLRQAVSQRDARGPTEFAPCPRGIQGIAQVMARAVGHRLDELGRLP